MISSSDTVSVSLGLILNIFTNKSLEADRIKTIGLKIALIIDIGLAKVIATFSGANNAILFGNNSPNTNVKYDKIKVIITNETPSGIPMLWAMISDRLDAAVALEKNPAKVIPT